LLTYRGYVANGKGNQLNPTPLALSVNAILMKEFPRIVNPSFTPEMELGLDEIANGDKKGAEFLSNFFTGEQGLQQKCLKVLETMDRDQVSIVPLPQVNGDEHVVKVGKYGAYLELEDDKRIPLPFSLQEDLSAISDISLQALIEEDSFKRASVYLGFVD